MDLVASRIRALPRAGIRVIFDAAQGIPDVVHLEIGQPDFPTPAPICAAAAEAIGNGATRYTPNAGTLELRQDLAGHLRRSKGLEVSADEIVVTTGGIGALASSLEAIIEPGQEVLLPDPGWPNYASMVVCAGGAPTYYDLLPEAGYQPTAEDVAVKITERTRAVLVNSPSNPTGAVIDEDTTSALLHLARERELIVISDEVYEDFVFGGPCPTFLRDDSRDFVIAVYSFSKTYSMTGWRVGYAVAPKELAAEITKLQEVYYACASSVSQAAARAALTLDRAHVDEMVRTYQRRRDIVHKELLAQGIEHVLPAGAFYCLVDISPAGMNSMDFALALLHAEHVAVAPGETFGRNARHAVRIAFVVDDDNLRRGVRRLARFIRAKGNET